MWPQFAVRYLRRGEGGCVCEHCAVRNVAVFACALDRAQFKMRVDGSLPFLSLAL